MIGHALAARFFSRHAAAIVVAGAALLGVIACRSVSGTTSCSRYQTQCGTVCDQYCDSFSCRPACYDTCWDVCVDGVPGTTVPAMDGGSAPGAAPPILCSPCKVHSDCNGGNDTGANKCVTLTGGAVCGVQCKAQTDCPSSYECVGVDNTLQCVPITRVCEAPKPPAECGPERACAPGLACFDGRCATKCATTDTCRIGEVCAGNQLCTPYEGKPCASDVACGRGERCGATSRCTPICLDASDCPKGWACGAGGLCVSASPSDGGITDSGTD